MATRRSSKASRWSFATTDSTSVTGLPSPRKMARTLPRNRCYGCRDPDCPAGAADPCHGHGACARGVCTCFEAFSGFSVTSARMVTWGSLTASPPGPRAFRACSNGSWSVPVLRRRRPRRAVVHRTRISRRITERTRQIHTRERPAKVSRHVG